MAAWVRTSPTPSSTRPRAKRRGLRRRHPGSVPGQGMAAGPGRAAKPVGREIPARVACGYPWGLRSGAAARRRAGAGGVAVSRAGGVRAGWSFRGRARSRGVGVGPPARSRGVGVGPWARSRGVGVGPRARTDVPRPPFLVRFVHRFAIGAPRRGRRASPSPSAARPPGGDACVTSVTGARQLRGAPPNSAQIASRNFATPSR